MALKVRLIFFLKCFMIVEVIKIMFINLIVILIGNLIVSRLNWGWVFMIMLKIILFNNIKYKIGNVIENFMIKRCEKVLMMFLVNVGLKINCFKGMVFKLWFINKMIWWWNDKFNKIKIVNNKRVCFIMGFCDFEIGLYAFVIVSFIEKLMLLVVNIKFVKMICKKIDAYIFKNNLYK